MLGVIAHLANSELSFAIQYAYAFIMITHSVNYSLFRSNCVICINEKRNKNFAESSFFINSPNG